ncbi:MAG: cysteine desulfurase [Saprospiraceae bacterium]|uniref:cysteine desulfurase n=1 Tax=Candidatus Opimibacter skivensis TaxID=2982028 RepID=A0A9D7XMR1_9BACT|nr:cysteine desulfurase [Candidatus Opimibacter skivensis]
MGKIQKPVYLDYHATTPVDLRVLETMLPYFTEYFGNPASRSHPYGWQASEAVEIARKQVSDLLSVHAQDIFFTSGSTEGLNMAIKGLAESLRYKGKHIISISTEHHAVLDPLHWLESKGYEITLLPVDTNGMIDYDQLKSSIRSDTIMVIVMWANNETGVLHDMKSIGEICRDKGVALVSDGTQAVGKVKVDPHEAGIDMLVLSAHKMYGPKGTGAIYMNTKEKKLKPEPLIHGGGHEMGFRSGTLNVPGIVGLGMASHLRQSNMDGDMERIKSLIDKFENKLLSTLEHVSVNGSLDHRLYTVSNLKVAKVDSQAVMTKLRTKLAISSGSACSSADPSPSHVLLAMGLSAEEAKGSFRISLGVPTTSAEMELGTKLLSEAILEYRSESPVWQMFKQGIEL